MYIKHNPAKASALRGKKIGGGGISLTPPGASRAHQARTRGIPRCGLAPRATVGSPTMSACLSILKAGYRAAIIDVTDLHDKDGAPLYERGKTGAIHRAK